MVKLNVPLVAQRKSDTCWHASAQMIWYYWQGRTGRSGPMNTIDNWSKNKPILPEQFIKLAEKVGMAPLPDRTDYTPLGLEVLLRVFGPIWCAGYWYGVGHIIVLTGIDKQKVFINDPDGGVAKEESLDWFNDKLARVARRMMYKDPAAY